MKKVGEADKNGRESHTEITVKNEVYLQAN